MAGSCERLKPLLLWWVGSSATVWNSMRIRTRGTRARGAATAAWPEGGKGALGGALGGGSWGGWGGGDGCNPRGSMAPVGMYPLPTAAWAA